MRKNFKRFFTNLIEIFKRPDMSILPGQLAYFFILSLVPTITLMVYIAKLLSISLEDLSNYFNLPIDNALVSMLTPYVDGTELSFGLVVLLVVGTYIASNGTHSMIVTANNIYGIGHSTFLERRIKAIIMIFILIMLFLFILLVPIFGNFILSFIEKLTGHSDIFGFLSFMKTPFSWFMIFFFIKTLYTIAPDKQIPSAQVNKGAIFASIGWLVATEVYLYYVGHFANYNLYYSGLSNIAILMIWMYILSTIFVIGMSINQMEEEYELTTKKIGVTSKTANKSQHINDEKK